MNLEDLNSIKKNFDFSIEDPSVNSNETCFQSMISKVQVFLRYLSNQEEIKDSHKALLESSTATLKESLL